jgi:predicted nuclease of restriction endonuclease-like (RecB) superfamily
MIKQLENNEFYSRIIDLLQASRNKLVRAVNQTMVLTYFEIGRVIIEEEQNGGNRAEYGKKLLKGLSTKLTTDFGRGYSVDNLENMRKLFLAYSKSETPSRISSENISETLSRKSEKEKQQSLSIKFNLSWSHYLILIRIKNENERSFYEIESEKNNWSVRELDRQINASLFERLSMSKNKKEVIKLAEKGQIVEKAIDIIKDPYVLEFLNLPESNLFSETELEAELINKLESFLMELGKGFTFVGRQVRFTFDEEHFKVDLVFYNRILKCFVLLDLKIGKLKHQDLGQMQMYVNYYDRFVKLEEENKTIGIILCKDKKDTMVEITLPENNEQIFASKYELVLPSKKELQQLIENKNN